MNFLGNSVDMNFHHKLQKQIQQANQEYNFYQNLEKHKARVITY